MDLENSGKEIEELRVLESNLQNFLVQRQTIQFELNEIENASAELKKTDDEVYKIISGIMVKSKKEKIEKDLCEKKKVLEMKVDALEKQEKLLEKKAEELKAKISGNVEKKK